MAFFKKMKSKDLITFLSAVVLLFSVYGSVFAMDSVPEPRENPYYMRVLLLESQSSVNVSLKGKYKISTFYTDETLLEGININDVKCVPANNAIMLNDTEFKIFGFRITSEERNPVFINGKPYRGEIDIIRQPDNTLSMVNRIDIEVYLRGVLRAEVPPWWPMEALKAQAVVARTFAVYQKQQNAAKDFDVRADTYSQVYGGAKLERRRTNKAVLKTTDIILTYDSKVLPAFYHSCCGGHTENVSNLWNMDYPPLHGVSCPYCGQSPYSSWRFKMKLSEIESALKKSGYKVAFVQSLETVGYTGSGRVKIIRVNMRDGYLDIPSNEFRIAVGSVQLKSTKFTIKMVEDIVIFDGAGWGHGVGFCQWGAYGKAMTGAKFADILKFYYPGAEIMKIE